MQSGFFRHAARQLSIVPLAGVPVLEKPHASMLLTLELKHEAPASIIFAWLHIQTGTLKGDYATKRGDRKDCVNVEGENKTKKQQQQQNWRKLRN